MNNMENEFIDEKGENQKLEITSNDNYQVNMGGENYKIAEGMRNPKAKVRKRSIWTTNIGPEIKRNGIFTSNIGPGSEGFAGIFTLASIIALGSVIVAFIVLRF